MNACTFAGRIGTSAELRQTSNDQAVANFSLAVDRPKRNGEKQNPIWIKVTVWGKMAEALTEYLTKGSSITVSGSIDLREYNTSDGETRTELVLNARDITLQGKGNAGEAAEPAEKKTTTKNQKRSNSPF